MSDDTPDDTGCCCASLPDLAVVPMGADGLDERVFSSLEVIKKHGGCQWWLYVSTCRQCSQNWMIAQDERIYDNYYLRRLTPETRREIVEENRWPEEFLTYEQVLMLGRIMSKPWTFEDPYSPALAYTVEELRRERSGISADEIAYLLAIPVEDVVRMLPKPSLIDRLRALAQRR